MSINTYYTIIFMYEWMDTHTEARMTSQWGHKHTNHISRTALRVTSWVFHRFIWVKLSSYHIHTEMKRYSQQPVKIKVWFFEEIFVQQNVLLLKLWNLFLRNDHTTFLTCFNCNSKFPLFAKKIYLIFNNFKINEIDVLCFHLITRYTTEFLRKKKTFHTII